MSIARIARFHLGSERHSHKRMVVLCALCNWFAFKRDKRCAIEVVSICFGIDVNIITMVNTSIIIIIFASEGDADVLVCMVWIFDLHNGCR